ncbi:hypothetical protein TNIN_385951 [Trichonephila inaurata madagascariensis]|uniref:Uncharacterized protein n=1 Tax=Trichonephila inaurata madagascariensis TaxID=2747483 RepID=A0A8X6YGX9_9ARAC|nr:hypothetical protein TNIN_385951 [Trichonephila inaurata madagascariensis]
MLTTQWQLLYVENTFKKIRPVSCKNHPTVCHKGLISVAGFVWTGLSWAALGGQELDSLLVIFLVEGPEGIEESTLLWFTGGLFFVD